MTTTPQRERNIPTEARFLPSIRSFDATIIRAGSCDGRSERQGGMINVTSSPMDPPIQTHVWRRRSVPATQADNHSFSLPTNRTSVIYWLITSPGGHRWGRKLDFCICEERIAAKSHLLKLNPREKCYFFVLPFRQHRGCPLWRKKKNKFYRKIVHRCLCGFISCPLTSTQGSHIWPLIGPNSRHAGM